MSLFEARGLSVRYGGVSANEDVDLEVPEGALVGLIGPNGAGKTTFLDAVTGFTPPSAGTIRFGGEVLDDVPAHRRAARGLVRTFQSLELFEDVSVRDNLLAAADRPGWRDLVRDLVRPERPTPGAEAADRALRLVGLEAMAERQPTELSHGQRTLVGVARALAMQPRLLLLDEPAGGLDTAESEELGHRLRGLVDDDGISVLLVDHDMGLVFGVCDVIHVLDFGRVIASGTPEEIRRDPQVLSAYLGSAAAEVEDLADPGDTHGGDAEPGGGETGP